MKTLGDLKVQIFADCADLNEMHRYARHSIVRGFTTNPSLMRAAGITDYLAFAREVLSTIPERPVSFEVVADQLDEMKRQALFLARLGGNVVVKIPVTTTRGESTAALVRSLLYAGLVVNVTAILSVEQVLEVVPALEDGRRAYVSVFAGRIADTGRDPVPVLAEVVELLRPYRGVEVLWASPRELLNIFQADAVGCHVVTLTADLLRKLPLLGRDLREYSLETVRMFWQDALNSRYAL